VLYPDEVSLAAKHFCNTETRRTNQLKPAEQNKGFLSMTPHLKGKVHAQGVVLST